MKISRNSRKSTTRHGEPVILFAVGGYRFATPANEVDEIRDLQGLESVKTFTERSSVSKVKATLKRANRTYFVVDAAQHFRQRSSTPTRLMILRQQPVAVLVDSIDRMSEIDHIVALPRVFRGDEKKWYRGLSILNGVVVPVVNTTVFLTPAEQVMATSIVSRIAKGATA